MNQYIEPNRTIKGKESLKLIITILCLINSSILCYQGDINNYQPFMFYVFFGNVASMFLYFIIFIIHFKSRIFKNLIIVLDIYYCFFHFFAFIWGAYLYYTRNEFLKDWDLFIFTYINIWYIFVGIIVIKLVKKIITKIKNNKEKNDLKEYMELSISN